MFGKIFLGVTIENVFCEMAWGVVGEQDSEQIIKSSERSIIEL